MSHLQKAPLLLNPRQGNEVFSLKRVEFQKSGGYDERWLQELISARPEVLPIGDIEPAFTPAISVCMELPLASKSLDVFLATPLGDLVAVECKLWRNPEARREVISQAIDYAAKLQSLGYGELQTAVRGARKDESFDLYRHVLKEAGEPEPSMEESQFIDAVSRYLRRGRCLLLIVGDGIRQEAEAMTEFLQQHAGAHFALAMVSLEIYESQETGHRLVVPSVPVQTTNIVRGIVHIEEGRPVVTAPPPEVGKRSTTLSEDEFFAQIDKLRPGAATALRTFLDAQQDLRVDYAVRKTLVVHMNAGDSYFTPFVIYPTGAVDTGWTFGQKQAAKAFSDSFSAAIPAALIKETPKTWYVPRHKSDGKQLTVLDILDNQAGCRSALEVLFNALTRDTQSRQDDDDAEGLRRLPHAVGSL
jgi:hypothetical protein